MWKFDILSPVLLKEKATQTLSIISTYKEFLLCMFISRFLNKMPDRLDELVFIFNKKKKPGRLFYLSDLSSGRVVIRTDRWSVYVIIPSYATFGDGNNKTIIHNVAKVGGRGKNFIWHDVEVSISYANWQFSMDIVSSKDIITREFHSISRKDESIISTSEVF